MNKRLILLVILIGLIACSNQTGQKDKSPASDDKYLQTATQIPIILSTSLENRKDEFQTCLIAAHKRISVFANRHGWEHLTTKSFMDSVLIFDNKNNFDKTVLQIAGMDTTIKLPKTALGALENRILLLVSPEIYLKNYPVGEEENYYDKIMTHEMAHRLHIRILNGKEDDMGPVWFYEGFAVFAADQLIQPGMNLNKEKMYEIMSNPERGSYTNYGYIFRYFADKVPLKEMITNAKNEDFNEWLISTIEELNNSEEQETVMNDTTPKVTGIGGIFFRSNNPKEIKEWYGKNLGMAIDEYGSPFEFRNANRPDEINYLMWSPFIDSTEYFNPSTKEFMINYRVQNIEGLVKKLRENGVTIVDEIEEFEYGKFVHIMDPEGNKIELWEPIDSVFTQMGGKTTK